MKLTDLRYPGSEGFLFAGEDYRFFTPLRKRVISLPVFLAGVFCILGARQGHAQQSSLNSSSEAEYQPFRSPGMFMNDFRFVQKGEFYYAFYLQIPRCVGPSRIWGDGRSYGVARSKNLLVWEPFSVAAAPNRSHWADRAIHSGCVVYDEARKTSFLFYTGVGSKRQGVGLARSDDMESWTMDEDILIEYPDRWTPDARQKALSAEFEGKTYQFLPGGDPYVFPEKVDGYYWMWVQSQVFYEYENLDDGGLLLYRSRELDRGWEFDRIVFAPTTYERYEVPFAWKRGTKFYLYVGGVFEDFKKASPSFLDKLKQFDPWLVNPQKPRHSVNLIYEASDIRGPWKPVPGGPLMKHPDHPWSPHYYVWNILRGPDGGDYIFGWSGDTLGKPYPLGYGSDGSLEIGQPVDRWPK